jgi:endo-1,4-beta-D-glucanase Y
MGDQTLFDGLWKYEQQQLDVNGLMNWSVGPDGTMNTNGAGGATDADEDMAFALVMADKQWGGQGSLSQTYATYALKQIQAVWANEIWNYKVVIPGDQWGASSDPSSFANINVSYFAPAYYRIFAVLDPLAGSPGMDNWAAAIDSSYSILSLALNATNGNRTNGLVPAWCSSAGGPPGPGQPTNYQYDSCRTPFRIGLDWCWNAEPRAQQYVALTSAFFNGIGAANITDGYQTNGSADPGYTAMAGELSAAFIGPAGVGAMGGAMSSSTYQPFVNGAYNEVATLQLLAAGTYYEDSWTVMSLLMMSANFLDYTRY